MLSQRVLVILILLPLVVAVVYLGGWYIYIFTLIAMLISAWEYWRMFHIHGYSPSLPVMMAGILCIILSRIFFGFEGSGLILSGILLLSSFVHILQFEHGNEKAATNFAITVLGTLYMGWLSSYLISIRELPDGMWWTLIVLPGAALADSGAFLVGRKWGKHKLSKKVSPNKSWEGYFGGILFSTPLTALLTYMWAAKAPNITVFEGFILGLVMSSFPTLGDLTISLIKRECGVKDTSRIIPGHGGVLDRVDSFLWALPIGYYIITICFL